VAAARLLDRLADSGKPAIWFERQAVMTPGGWII